MRTRLPNVDKWTPEFQRQLNGELERALERLNEYALVPYGGLEGQVLTKTSDRPYVMEWADDCCGADGTPLPGTDVVGTKKLTCGSTVSFTPVSDVPASAVGDLAVWLVQPQHSLLTDYDEALVKPPAGWSVFTPAPQSYPLFVNYEDSFPAIFYKFLEAGDLNATHTCTETHSAVSGLCSAVYVYRNVNTARPFGARAHGMSQSFAQGTNWGHPLPIYSTAQHVLDIWRRRPSGANSGVGFPYTDANYWPLFDSSTMDGYVEILFGTDGGGGDQRANQVSAATWAASILNDENLVPYENEAQSVTMGTWVGNEVTVTRTLGDWCTYIEPSTAVTEHYVEFEQAFEAGDEITFAAFVYAASAQSHGYWLSVIDPDDDERGRLWYHQSGNPGWYYGTTEDPLSDYGTVWRTAEWKNEADGVPETPVASSALFMVAPSTGTYKFRIYVHPDSTDTIAARTAAGAATSSIGVRHVLIRHGHVTPYVVPTGASAVTGSGASYSTPTRGWAASGHDSRHLAIALNPAYENNETPLCRMRGIGEPFGSPENPFETDGVTVKKPYGSTTDAVVCYAADQPIYPVVDGVAQKYYFEIEVTAGSPIGMFFGVTNAVTITPSSDASNLYPAYGMYYASSGTITWTDIVGNVSTSSITIATGDVFGCEVDFSGNTVKFYHNGVLVRTTTILTQFPTSGGANFVCANSPACPLYLVAGCVISANTLTARLRPEWLYGPSSVDFVAYDYTGSENVSTWVNQIPTAGSGAQILYQDPSTGATMARSITGGEGIEVIQYDETVDVALKIDELTTQTPDPANDYVPFYDASTGGSSKVAIEDLAGSTSPTTTAGDLIKRGASADERLAVGTDGQVLTVVTGQPAWADATGGSGGGGSTPVNDGARVKRTTNQSISTGVQTAISFDTEVRDDGGYWVVGSPTRLTITNAGWYLVNGGVEWGAGTTQSRYLFIGKNGTSVLGIESRTAGTGDNKQNVSTVAYLDAGDYLTLEVIHSQGSSLNVLAQNDGPYFAIHRLGIASSPGNPVNDGAEVRRTTDLALSAATWTLLAFNTESRDDGGYWDAGSSSRFTITNSGWYALSLVAFFGADNVQCGVAIGKNGSPATSTNEIASGHFGASAAYQRAQAQTIRYLAAGDYVEAYAYASGAATVAGATIPATFSIHRLGTPAAQEFDPATDHNFYDDFVATDFSGNDAWSIGTANGGSIAQSSESNHPGTIVFSTNTNSAGYALATLSPIGDSAFTVEQLYFMPTGTDELHFEACIKCGTLSTVGSPNVYRVGFSTDAGTYSHYAMFDFTTTSTLRTKGSGGAADVTLSSSVTASTWHKVRITLTATEIRAYIDDVLVATQSTAANLPTGGFTPMLFAQNLGGTGVNHVLTVDYVRVWGTVTRS